MKLLLDTHALIWAMEDNPRLSDDAIAAISQVEWACFVSVVSLWEMAIKRSLGKLRLPDTWLQELEDSRRDNGLGLLPVSAAHCGRIDGLPFHHRDPFDRMLVAQALEEGLSIVSADANLDAYGVERIW